MRRLTQTISILIPIGLTALWVSLRPASSAIKEPIPQPSQPAKTQELISSQLSNRVAKRMSAL